MPQGAARAVKARYANQWNNNSSESGKGSSWKNSNGGAGGGGWQAGGGKGGPYDAAGCSKGKSKGPSNFKGVFSTAHTLFKQSLGTAMHVPDEQQVYIQNLPPDTTDENLYQLFS